VVGGGGKKPPADTRTDMRTD